MKSSFISRISKIFILASLFFSCSSDLDFNQVNDFKLEPVLVANLAYFDVSSAQIENSNQQQIAIDVEDFDIFRNKFFKKNLAKAEFNFEIQNTINKGFKVDFLLLDKDNQTLDTISFEVPKYEGIEIEDPSGFIKYPVEVFEDQRLELLKQTTKIGFVIRMLDGSQTVPINVGNLKLRSSATVYMKIE